MKKYADLVLNIELEKCCKMHGHLQLLVSMQPKTSPPKIAKIKICKILENVANLLMHRSAEGDAGKAAPSFVELRSTTEWPPGARAGPLRHEEIPALLLPCSIPTCVEQCLATLPQTMPMVINYGAVIDISGLLLLSFLVHTHVMLLRAPRSDTF